MAWKKLVEEGLVVVGLSIGVIKDLRGLKPRSRYQKEEVFAPRY